MMPGISFVGKGKHGKTRALFLKEEMAGMSFSLPYPLCLTLEVSSTYLSISFKGAKDDLDFTRFFIKTSSPIYTGASPSRKQPLIRAISMRKKKNLLVLDGTCGFGEDAYLLARYGFSVIGIEKNPLIYLILRDTLARLGIDYPTIIRKIKIILGDCRDIFKGIKKGLFPSPDVVYLDPMYPSEYKRKARGKKKTQFLRLIIGEGKERDTERLLAEALKIAKHKVVIKRPRKYPPICREKIRPAHQVIGRGHRFDIYLIYNKRGPVWG